MNRFLWILLFPVSVGAQPLQLEKIMAGNEFIGYQPEAIQWSPESDCIYFRWKMNGEFVAPYHVCHLTKEKGYPLSPPETINLPVDGFEVGPNGAGIFFQKGTRLYSWRDGKSTLLYEKTSGFRLFKVLDQNRIIVEEGNQLFLLGLSPFIFRQLTFFENGKAPDEGDKDSFLGQQQTELFEVVRLRAQRDSAAKAHREMHEPKSVEPFYLDKRQLGAIQISENLKYCAFRCDKYAENKQTHIESYLTEDGYSSAIPAREKVGAAEAQHQVYIWDLHKDSVISIDFAGLNGIKTRPEFFEDYEENFTNESENPKNVLCHLRDFNANETRILFEVHSYDNKDRWICYYDLPDSKLIEVDHQHDEAWIGGPGISEWRAEGGNVGWIGNDSIFYQSETTGYSHLYSFDIRQQKTTHLTSGNWEIHDAKLSRNGSRFYITANKTHPGNRDFYILDLKTAKLIPVLTADGNHEVKISPDEKWLAVRYSNSNTPWELYKAPLKENTRLFRMTFSTSEKFREYEWRKPEVVEFIASDGVKVYARLYKPETAVKNGAGVLFVHGAGYLQNAHNWWSHYHREYMFNNLLCDMGYTVMDIDYRASEGYGRDFRTGIYRHMGGKDLSDHLDGRKYLIDKLGVDSSRVGIYGGSYGGFITLMALLTEPGKFKCGAALRSVTDWAHYNHEYTSNILNTPETDPLAFKMSSPIYFAENLQDRLLMLHGVEDDNVQYQDVIRLSQRFIELGKTNWDLVAFPVEPHGFRETSSWIEEYRRILEMFEEELAPKE